MGVGENNSVYATFPDMAKKRKNAAAVSLGQKRWKGLTAEERSEIARKAIQARWDRVKKEKK